MKLISLNLWAGREYDKLAKFVKEKSNDVDIFCFQEMLDIKASDRNTLLESAKSAYAQSNTNQVNDLYKRLKKLLPHFNSFLSESYSSGGERIAIFFKDDLRIISNGYFKTSEKFTVLVGKEAFSVSSMIQYITFEKDSKVYTIANIHGLWQGGGKLDTPERLYQSDRINEFLNGVKGRKILVGDFNLLPDTESIRRIDGTVLDLIKKYDIKTTRSVLAAPSKGKHADYAFVSRDVKVNSFEVLQVAVSDHLPLYLDFS